MANTTFSGPVISKNGFIGTGPGSTVALTANTSLTVNAHAGRILLTQDADGIFTLPSINANANGASAGETDYNNLKFTGAAIVAVDDGAKKAFFPGATNDVLSMNGTTTGGIVGSVITVTALESAQYLVHNTLILGSGTIVTPFSDS
jgi:hypothetical protein